MTAVYGNDLNKLFAYFGAKLGEALDVVVFLKRVAQKGPVVYEILEVDGVQGGEYQTNVVELGGQSVGN